MNSNEITMKGTIHADGIAGFLQAQDTGVFRQDGSDTSFWFSPNITFIPAPVSIRSVVDLRDYTFARREREWEVGEAIGRIRAWAGGSEKADIDWNKYRMAFLWCDTENAQEFNSYRFPVVDIIDGNPHYIWRAVTDAADRLEQSDISDDDKAEIERNLCALYERAVDQFDADDIECPFTDDGDDELEENNTNMDEILALREQYESAKTTHDLNEVWERGRELGLEKNGRVTIPAHPGEERSEAREVKGPEDVLGRQVRVTKDAEIREEFEDGKDRLVGYAAKFDKETVIGFWYKFRERIARGAFTKTIQEADIRHLFNHDPNWVLGRNKSGTLRLSEDSIGLRYDVDLNPNDPQAVSVKEKVARGDVNQSSFAFTILRELWEEPDDVDGGELPLRTILEAKLFDTSTVTYPAYEDTTALIAASARSATMQKLGINEEVLEMIANDRFTPDAAEALRSIAQQAEELAARCEDGEPCPRAAEEAPADGDGNVPADEESPGGEEGTDNEIMSEKDKEVLLGDQNQRSAELDALLAGIITPQEVKK